MMIRRQIAAATAALCLAALSLLGSPAAAPATEHFSSVGSGAGQLKSPNGIAVDSSNGHLYVVDRQNHRISVFDSSAKFLFAFGWGVADGTTAGLQTCSSSCFAGLETLGASGFFVPSRVAVDNSGSSSQGDVYVTDGQFGRRVQRFSIDDNGSADPSDDVAVFEGAWGGGVVTGGAAGKGDLTAGSATVANATTTKKSFDLGQRITGAGIPAGTRIVAIDTESITLSKLATTTGSGVTLTVAEGAGNVPVNEVQVITMTQPTYDPSSPSTSTFTLRFYSKKPSSFSVSGGGEVKGIPRNASASQLRAALESLPNIDPGDITVTSPNPGGVAGTSGGPYTITFNGPRYSDTDVEPLGVLDPGVNGSTSQNGGGGAEVCSPANVGDCVGAVEGRDPGQLAEEVSVAVGEDGVVYTVNYLINSIPGWPARIQKFEPSGAFAGESVLPDPEARPNAMAVDSSGRVYLSTFANNGRIEKYDVSGPSAALLDSFAAGQGANAVTLDPAGNIYASSQDAGRASVAKFDSSGKPLKRFGYGDLKFSLLGLAYYPTAKGDIFGIEQISDDPLVLLSPPSPGPVSCCAEAKPIGNSKATLNAGLNPEGKETKYHFEYVDDANFDKTGFASAAKTPEQTLAPGINLETVSAQVPVFPETTYHFRLVASNEEGPTGQEAEFTSLPPLEIGDSWSTDVDFTSARLNAEVNPLGIPATAYFQYVDEATFQASGFDEAKEAPAVGSGADPIDLGSGEGIKVAATQISGLQPDTAYRFRVVAEDEEGGVHFVTRFGDPVAFRTFPTALQSSASCPNQAFRTGASANLPDCRAYEMVSPLGKGNGDISVRPSFASFPARLDQVSEDGNSLSFSSERSFGDAISAPFTSQYLATREAGRGWDTDGISPARGARSLINFANARYDVEFKAFSPDLTEGWLFHDTGLLQDQCATPGFPNLYRRDNLTGDYEALTTAAPLNQVPKQFLAETQGTSADGINSVYRANAKLTPDAADVTANQLYLHVAGEEPGDCGELKLVSILPSGKAASTGASAGTGKGSESREAALSNAISEDGSRVYWTAQTSGPGTLYLWSESSGKSAQVASGAAQFWTASPDGSKAIYSVGESLFEYDAVTKKSALIAGKAAGVAGAAEDASRVYFVSKEAIGGEGEAGKPNLYLREGGINKFIATVDPGDTTRGGNDFFLHGFLIASPAPVSRGTRTTPDGDTLAFVSTGSLTGYDNKSAADGEAALELYVYEASSDSLNCVSCNPSGARPRARQIFNREPGTPTIPVAAQLAPAESQLFAPRSLSSDGSRLFFEAYDALLPRDTNGRLDVYEWQRAANEAQCEEAGAEMFAPSAGGCLSLISSGQSPVDSEFVDATPDGQDAFFKTSSSLLPQDPGLIDIYDARANGGLPGPVSPPAACEGEACQGPYSPPEDPTPASSSGEYAGNLAPPKKKPCPKGKARRHGKCVKKHKKHQNTKHQNTKQKKTKRADTERRQGR